MLRGAGDFVVSVDFFFDANGQRRVDLNFDYSLLWCSGDEVPALVGVTAEEGIFDLDGFPPCVGMDGQQSGRHWAQ